jgi:hypothetical protein
MSEPVVLEEQIPGSANSQVQGSTIFVPSEVYLDSANSQVKVNTISIITGAEQPGYVFFLLTEADRWLCQQPSTRQ